MKQTTSQLKNLELGHGWNKGKSSSLKGVPRSEETRLKISLANRGKKRSLKAIKNMSDAQSGKPKPWKAGERSVFWRGGISKITDSIRSSLQHKEWRTGIFKRDNFTCQMCGQFGGELCVDHYPKTFSEILHQYGVSSLEDAINCSYLWDTNNNRTLCVPCHRLTPTYGVNKKLSNIAGAI